MLRIPGRRSWGVPAPPTPCRRTASSP